MGLSWLADYDHEHFGGRICDHDCRITFSSLEDRLCQMEEVYEQSQEKNDKLIAHVSTTTYNSDSFPFTHRFCHSICTLHQWNEFQKWSQRWPTESTPQVPCWIPCCFPNGRIHWLVKHYGTALCPSPSLQNSCFIQGALFLSWNSAQNAHNSHS